MKLPRAHLLSPEQLAGQLLVPRFEIAAHNRDAPVMRRQMRLLARHAVGGVLFQGGSPAQLRYWTTQLAGITPVPPLLLADLPTGLGGSFDGGTVLPHPLALGAAGDGGPDGAAILAQEARAVGLQAVAGPALGMSSEWRCLHTVPERAIELLRDWRKACDDSGIILFAAIDTDFTRHDERLKAVVATGVRALMPANRDTLAVLHGRRHSLRYPGVLAAWHGAGGAGSATRWQQALSPLLHGADLMVAVRDLPFVHYLLVERLRSDPDFRRQAEASVERIWSLKRDIFRRTPRQRHPDRVFSVVEKPAHVGTAARLAEAGLVPIRRSDRYPFSLPVRRTARHTCVQRDPSPGSELLDARLKEILPTGISGDLGLSTGEDAVCDLEIITVVDIESPLDATRLAKRVEEIRPDTAAIALVVFGPPAALAALPPSLPVDLVLLACSDVPPVWDAVWRAIFGAIPLSGSLPDLPTAPWPGGGLALGDSAGVLTLPGQLEAAVRTAIAAGAPHSVDLLSARGGTCEEVHIAGDTGGSRPGHGGAGQRLMARIGDHLAVRRLISLRYLEEAIPIQAILPTSESVPENLTLMDLLIDPEDKVSPALQRTLVSELVSVLAGIDRDDFVRTHIAQPLGIRGSMRHGEGEPVSTRELAVLGRLLLQGGWYGSRRLFSTVTTFLLMQAFQRNGHVALEDGEGGYLWLSPERDRLGVLLADGDIDPGLAEAIRQYLLG